ncbi:AAA family ATPase [Microbacterium tumbae]
MRSRSSDPVSAALQAATTQVVAAVAALSAANPVVLVDGRSGAGKTTLSRLVAADWPVAGRPQLIALDSLYPGWDGLDAGVRRALDGILRPHGRGRIGTWNRWDWERDVDAEAHAVDPSLGVILEGCGAITPQTASIADVRVWVESPDDSRRHRALDRDGDGFRPHWDRWAAQELAHIERDDPRSLATLTVTVP